MKNAINRIIENTKLLFNPVIVNAYVFFDKNGNVIHKNWGDDINYYFMKEIIKNPLVLYGRTSLAFRLKLKNFLIIGSTIDMLCKDHTEVWGAGIINGNKPLSLKPGKVHAVRGPLTREKLIREGIICEEIYGDPALIVPLYYQPNYTPQYKYGIISHVSNQNFIDKILVAGRPIVDNKDILIIKMNQYNHWHDIIDKICKCQSILSSSLHGLIISEAYGIPNVWIEFGKPLIGGHFKFHDFFLSIHCDRNAPVYIEDNNLPIDKIDRELSNWNQGYIDLIPLIKSCPFKIKRALYENKMNVR